jgi:hypothetical protein
MSSWNYLLERQVGAYVYMLVTIDDIWEMGGVGA